MKKCTLLAITGLLITATLAVGQTKKSDEELIQIAILLDASNSMDGLIGQAKTQLWKIVNELALAKRSGVTPRLEVAFYEYGKSSLPSSQGYIRQIVPLSTDLDKISDELFKLATNGGDEYCGWVIRQAASELAWNPSPKVMKAIFIAGNEPFTQGSIDYTQSCKAAIAKGIVVNTIFCGAKQEGIDSKWKDGADLADGSFMNIDQNLKVEQIAAPQDSAIMALGAQLNGTYIGFGAGGMKRKAMQAEQDRNAFSSAPAAMVQRSVAKSSAGYNNSSWDLIDAQKEKKVDVAKLEEAELPAEMKTMSPKQRETYVEEKSKERVELQAKIATLNKDRRSYVLAQQKKSSAGGTLDQAVIQSIRREAAAKGFTFETK
jgi:hypothetical protein